MASWNAVVREALIGLGYWQRFGDVWLKQGELGPPVPHGFVAYNQLVSAVELGSSWRAEADFVASLRHSLNPINLICNFGGPPGGFFSGPFEIELADGRRVWTSVSPPIKSATKPKR